MCWELDPGPLQEWQAGLPAKPSLRCLSLKLNLSNLEL